MSRMMVYAWQDTTSQLIETKFGDHFVEGDVTLDEAKEHTRKYIRNAQFARKGQLFDSGKVLLKYWDISEFAQSKNKFYGASKIDDVIRPAIGKPGTQGKEFHAMPHEMLVNLVTKYLIKVDQPLLVASLSTHQYRVVGELLEAFKNNNVVLSELCARFGKTIMAGALAREYDNDLTVVVSYVQTVFGSFENDLLQFEQFRNHVHVDTKDSEYQTKIKDALAAGKKVIAYLSMCGSAKRQTRIDYLYGLAVSRLTVIDEADFGSHTENQAIPLRDALPLEDRILIMTGTNSDKAATFWKVDHMISVTYPELLIQKAQTIGGNAYPFEHKLQYFDCDTSRDLLAPNVEFYQMGLARPVEAAIARGEFEDELPSWSKFAANPYKASGFIVNVLEGIFLGKGGYDETNFNFQVSTNTSDEIWFPEHRVAMMFMPGSIRVEMLGMVAKIAQQALPGFKIIEVSGGNNMKNRTAQEKVHRQVQDAKEAGQSVLILASHLAQRSFSIPEIAELYLAYDSGSEGATIQKMSRTLTPWGKDKIGRVISLSFDPNRDDKFDAMILETVKNYAAQYEGKSAKEAMRDVLRTIDIFSCHEDGVVEFDTDEYLQTAIERKSISRVIGKISNISQLNEGELHALATGNADYFRNEKQAKTEKGKTRSNTQTKSKSDTKTPSIKKLEAQAREVVTAVAENIDILVHATGSATIDEALTTAAKSSKHKEYVKNNFGVPFEIVQMLFERKIVNRNLVELMM